MRLISRLPQAVLGILCLISTSASAQTLSEQGNITSYGLEATWKYKTKAKVTNLCSITCTLTNPNAPEVNSRDWTLYGRVDGGGKEDFVTLGGFAINQAALPKSLDCTGTHPTGTIAGITALGATSAFWDNQLPDGPYSTKKGVSVATWCGGQGILCLNEPARLFSLECGPIVSAKGSKKASLPTSITVTYDEDDAVETFSYENTNPKNPGKGKHVTHELTSTVSIDLSFD